MTDTDLSKTWRRLLTGLITADYARRWPGAEPATGDIVVRAVCFIPASAGKDHPTGDVDKLARNILDAIHDTRRVSARGIRLNEPAFPLRDDNQVMRLCIDKLPESPGYPRGSHVSVTEVDREVLEALILGDLSWLVAR